MKYPHPENNKIVETGSPLHAIRFVFIQSSMTSYDSRKRETFHGSSMHFKAIIKPQPLHLRTAHSSKTVWSPLNAKIRLTFRCWPLEYNTLRIASKASQD